MLGFIDINNKSVEENKQIYLVKVDFEITKTFSYKNLHLYFRMEWP